MVTARPSVTVGGSGDQLDDLPHVGAGHGAA